MIQDIGPSKFDNSYRELEPRTSDPVLLFDRRAVLVSDDGLSRFPTFHEVDSRWWSEWFDLVYLFSIDDERFFLPVAKEARSSGAPEPWGDFSYRDVFEFRQVEDGGRSLAVSTGLQLCKWYSTHRFCGFCGAETVRGNVERVIACPECGLLEYPRINPAVIVAVRDGDNLLMTRYAGRQFKQRALVAGFCEVGETAEQTVHREVFEETGVRVKNIKFVADQPWGFDDDLLLGFVCDLDGSSKIAADTNELATAEWVPRDQIVEEDDGLTLTRFLIMKFKNGEL